MSQVNYETGKRSPDADYLLAASEAGIDVGYVVTGKRSGAPDFFRMATVFVLENIERRTGFSADVLSCVIESIADAAASEWLEDQVEIMARPDTPWDMTQWVHSSGIDEMTAALYENARLLRDIFFAVNTVLVDGNPRRVSGGKRVALVLMLFRAFRSAGEIDDNIVEEAVKLTSI